MITSLELEGFKNFDEEKLRLGPFTLIVGANASGKSNIRDAFRILHGIGRGYTLAEAIGGKYGSGGQVEWEEIRGAVGEIVTFGESSFLLAIDLELSRELPSDYFIVVARDEGEPGGFKVMGEQLSVGNVTVYTSVPDAPDPIAEQKDEAHLLLRMAKGPNQRKYGHRIQVRPDQPALTQLQGVQRVLRLHKDYAKQVTDVLGHFRFLDPSPDRMRQPAFPGQTVLGDSGENLPAVLREICTDDERKSVLSEWLRELTPMDVDSLEFPTDPTTGKINLAIREKSGRLVSAYSASDGTLRFLAVLAALLDKEPAKLYFFEEIDNGIHPARLHLLVDLIETQTANGEVQVVTTTHSPELVSIVNDRTFENSSVVCRPEDSLHAVIRPVSELPNARELRESQGLGRLLAGGWMETAVAFTNGSEDDDEASE